MKNIVLTGFMASGKTVVGKKLAEIIGFDFVDMDDYIEKKTGMTIGKIFKEYGEEYFRELESRTAEELSDRVNTVIACGGGTVLKKGNIDALRKKGIIINLEPTQEVIKQRLESAANGRPLLSAGDLAGALKRFHDRKPYYDNCDFKIKVEISKSVEQLAHEISDIYNRTIL